MVVTLYEQLISGEKSHKRILEEIADYKKHGAPDRLILDVDILNEYYRFSVEGLMKDYQTNNSVLKDAIKGKPTVKESLEELALVNKGIRRFLPWRKEDIHNERLEHLGKLIDKPGYLETNGILARDSMVMGTIYSFSGILIAYPLLGILSELPNIESIPSIIENSLKMYKAGGPEMLVFGGLSLMVGFAFSINRFFNNPPTDQAKYLDQKIQEFY